MLTFFKTKEPAKMRRYSPEVEQIHHEFNTASDRLLEEAKKILKQKVDERGKRLMALGFRGTEEAKIARRTQESIRLAQLEAEYITRSSQRYPEYKFITKRDAKKIAAKYSLVIGEVGDYRGYVPEENLRDIEHFMSKHGNAIEKARAKSSPYSFSPMPIISISGRSYTEPQGMVIVAPAKDFHLSSRQIIQDGVVMTQQEQALDPVVLYPANGGYLIVTAWGPEAEDPLVKQ